MFALKIFWPFWMILLAGNALAEAPLRVWTGIPPLAEMVRVVGGDQVEVHLLAGPGQNHETFAPSPRQLRALSGSDGYFSTGLPFETALLGRIRQISPNLPLFDTAAKIPLLELTGDDHACKNCQAHGHSHGHHSHRVDIHRWLSPAILSAQTEAIVQALSELRPQSAADFGANAEQLLHKIARLDEELHALLEPVRGSAFMINHPALGYFADHFGLRQIAIESEGVQPSPSRIRELSQQANNHSVRWVVIQEGQPRSAAVVLARNLDLPLIEVDPFNADSLGEMRLLAETLAATVAP